MKKQKYYLYLNREETRIVLQSLIRLKNSLLRDNRDTTCVDDTILKVIHAPVKKIKISRA